MKQPEGVASFSGLVDLMSADLGGTALLCSDDFFASMSNLVKPEPAVFDPDAYTERGKLMDGWESRRERVPGHDWCILKLGAPGEIHGVDIDTAHFLGNHPPFASLDGTVMPPDTTPETLRDAATWTPLLPEVPLQRGSHNLHAVRVPGTWTHVRLHIHPDGGVARLRVYGVPTPAPDDSVRDLACLDAGGRALACSDMFFSPMNNLLMPRPAEHMGKGWETRRSRPPGEDWIIVALGTPGALEQVVLDTNHFKGNFPDTAAVDGLYWPDAPASALVDHPDWTEIVAPTPLRAHQATPVPVKAPGPVTHVRLRIRPDGGVSRMRVMGRTTTDTPADTDRLLQRLNGMSQDEATSALTRCCGSKRWVAAMVASRPFTSRTHLFGLAEHHWWRLGKADWHEAFSHHPRIGASLDDIRARFADTARWSQGEQAGMEGVSDEVATALAEGNRAYEARYDHVFIVCASGLTPEQMLAHMRARMWREPAQELRVAAGEQAKITRLRLAKLEEDP